MRINSRRRTSRRRPPGSRRRRRRQAWLFRRILTFLVPAAVLVVLLLVFWGRSSRSSSLLTSYSVESEAIALSLPEELLCEAFASDLAVILDEADYYDASISTGAALLVNMDTLEVLHSEGAFVERANASTTKLVTLLVALKYGNLEDEVTVTAEALEPLVGTGSSSAGLSVGEVFTLKDLLYAMMLPSGNDAANVIAIHISGSIEAFCELMNETVYQLGATHSCFLSPHGLDADGHYTTAYDLYLIMHELLTHYPLYPVIAGSVSYTATYYMEGDNETALTMTWYNSCGYLTGDRTLPAGVSLLAVKTGTDTNAMYCLTCASVNGAGERFLAVVLQSQTKDWLYTNMSNLLSKTVN